MLERIDRVSPEWTIERVWRALYVERHNRELLQSLASLSTLAEGWRQLAARRAR
ncbi:MAG TPA: 3-alpha domain-containing protein [Luteibacter sp.]